MKVVGTLTLLEIVVLFPLFQTMCCMELFRDMYISGDHFLSDNGWDENAHQPIGIELYPPEIQPMFVNREKEVYINYTMQESEMYDRNHGNRGDSRLDLNTTMPQEENNISYVASITSKDPNIAIPKGKERDPGENMTDYIRFQIHPNRSSIFMVEATCVGHTSLIIRVARVFGDVGDIDELDVSPKSFHVTHNAKVATLAVITYKVTVIRSLRVFDFAFDWTIAVIVALNSLSIGCTTDWPSIRMHLRHPTSLLLAVCCQFIIMPTISLAIVKTLGVSPELGLGLFYIACVPGGGLGHVMVSIVQGDRALSVAINCITTYAAIGTFPLWIFGMGRFLAGPDTDHKLYKFVLCLAASAAAHAIGVFLHHVCPRGTDAFLNWFSKPFLLLYSLILITIGVYINIYMFTVLNIPMMVGAALLPMSGYLTGIFVSYISRQDSEYVKTISAESTMSNCLLVLVMVRFSLPQPDSDIASALPMWVLFTSPIPFILNYIVKSIKHSVWKKCAKRREKKYRHFSIVSSLLNITNVTTLSSSMSPKLLSPSEENSKSLIDEKITVL